MRPAFRMTGTLVGIGQAGVGQAQQRSRLVREVAAARLESHARTEVRTALIEAMETVYPSDVHNDPRGWPPTRRLDAAAFALVGDDAIPPNAEVAASLLLDRLATYRYFVLGDYAAQRPLFERTLAISEKMHGPEHPDTVTGLNNLASLLARPGRSRGGAAALRAGGGDGA